MPNEVKRPNSTGTALWSVNSHLNIDDAVLTGSTSGRGTSCNQGNKDDSEEQSWGFEDTTYTTVSGVTIHIDFGFTQNGDPEDFKVKSCNLIMTIDSVEEVNTSKSTSAAGESWTSITATGSWTQAQINGMTLKADFGGIDTDEDGYIYVAYADFTEAGGGGGGTGGGGGVGSALVNAIRVGTKIKI